MESNGTKFFSAYYDSTAKKWRGAPMISKQRGKILEIKSAPPVKPGSFCNPRQAHEKKYAGMRLLTEQEESKND